MACTTRVGDDAAAQRAAVKGGAERPNSVVGCAWVDPLCRTAPLRLFFFVFFAGGSDTCPPGRGRLSAVEAARGGAATPPPAMPGRATPNLSQLNCFHVSRERLGMGPPWSTAGAVAVAAAAAE